MKLRIHNASSTPQQREFFAKVFLILTKRLGISEYGSTVMLRFADIVDDVFTNGNMGPDVSPAGQQRIIIEGKQPQNYEINLKRDEMSVMLAAFCHEMVHLRQWVTGALGVKTIMQASGRLKLSHTYQGVDVNKHTMAYHDRPWEQEAHKLMWPLAEYVLDKLEEEKC